MPKNNPHAKLERLLRNWAQLKAFAESAITTLGEVEPTNEELLELMSDPFFVEFRAASLKRRKEWTITVVAHVERQLDDWLTADSETGQLRRKLISGLYLETPRRTLKDLSEKENIPIYKLSVQLDKAKYQLTSRIFGAKLECRRPAYTNLKNKKERRNNNYAY